jgi:hypothetical protein
MGVLLDLDMPVRKFHIFYLFLSIMLLTISSSSLYAIGNPDKPWGIGGQAVFRNYLEANDILFIVEYDLNYPSIPTEDPRLAFNAEVFNSSSSQVLATIPVFYYRHAFSTIYLTAAEATAKGITWDMANLSIRITANPVLFPVVTLGDNKDERPLTSGNTDIWRTGTLAGTTPTLVGNFILDIMGRVERSTGIEYIQITDSGDKLNSAGGTVVRKILPGSRTIFPIRFAFAASLNEEPTTVFTRSFETELKNNQPTSLTTNLDRIGQTVFGRSNTGLVIGGIGFLLLGISILGMIFNVTQAVTPAMVVGIPLVMAGTYLGVIPLGLVFAVFFFVLVLFGVTFIMSRMA